MLAVLVVCQHVVIMKDRKMQHQMGHDELTDVCNWEHLLQKAEVLYRTDTPRYIIYSDIAEFKLINELFGRETGNRILQKQAEQMKRYASEGCVYGRLGEDHFIFIVEQDSACVQTGTAKAIIGFCIQHSGVLWHLSGRTFPGAAGVYVRQGISGS